MAVADTRMTPVSPRVEATSMSGTSLKKLDIGYEGPLGLASANAAEASIADAATRSPSVPMCAGGVVRGLGVLR